MSENGFSKPKFSIPEGFKSFCRQERLIYCGIIHSNGEDLSQLCSDELFNAVKEVDAKWWIVPLNNEVEDRRAHLFVASGFFEES